MKRACLLLFATSACTDPAPQDLPAPTLTAVTPAATCGRDVAPVTLIGTGFIDGAEVVFERNGTAGYTPGGVATFGDTQIVVLTNAAEGAPAALEPPIVYDVLVRNPDGQEARLPAALTKYSDLASPT